MFIEVDILILNNASFHKDGIMVIEESRLWYLPPYSPDLNQSNIIYEYYWAKLKKSHSRKKKDGEMGNQL